MKYSVEKLRKNGYKVRVIHYRIHSKSGDMLPRRDFDKINPDYIATKGGKTEVEVRTPSGAEFKGVAKCNPKDTFSRRISLQIALGRALKIEKGE